MSVDMSHMLNGNKNCKIDVTLGKPEITNEEKKKLLNVYYRDIKENFENVPVLNNEKGMTLNDIYIEPFYEILSCHLEKKKDKYYNQFSLIDNSSIHEFMYKYLRDKRLCDCDTFKNKNANILLLLGQPGQGKSSFSRKFMFDYITRKFDLEEQVFMIRLRDISKSKDLLENPIEVLSDKLNTIIGFKPDLKEETVLVLDGLDELSMKEQLVTSRIDDFLETLTQVMKDYPKLKIIITSRTLYVNIEKLERRLKNDILTLHLKAFDLNNQKAWLKQYKKFYPNSTLTNEILNELHKKETFHILELISQPILLHMVAELNLSKDDLISNTNRAKIYDEMFNSVIRRKWEDEREQENLKGLDPEDVRDLLREVAFAIYKSDFEYIHKSKLEQLSFIKEFYEHLDIDISSNSEDLNGILKGVLISFYFQEVKKDNEDDNEDANNYAIEFLHKSLQEYLVAEKIYEELLRLIDKDRKKKYAIKDYKEVLKIVWELFSHKKITPEIQIYLTEIIKNSNIDNNLELAKRMSSFLVELFEKDFVYEYSLENDINIVQKSFYTFAGYWIVLTSLGIKENFIYDNIRDKFNKYIAYLLKENIDCRGRGLSFIHELIFSFSYQHLYGSYFVGCFFDSTDFSHASIESVRFSNSFFIHAKFDNAIIRDCDFLESYVPCDFKNTKIIKCNFHGVSLDGNSFVNSYLKEVNFSKVGIEKTDFSNCEIENCDFTGANITDSNFDGAILENIIIDDKNKKYFEDNGIDFTIAEKKDDTPF